MNTSTIAIIFAIVLAIAVLFFFGGRQVDAPTGGTHVMPDGSVMQTTEGMHKMPDGTVMHN